MQVLQLEVKPTCREVKGEGMRVWQQLGHFKWYKKKLNMHAFWVQGTCLLLVSQCYHVSGIQ